MNDGRYVVQVKNPQGVFGDAWLDWSGHDEVREACLAAAQESGMAGARAKVIDREADVVIAEYESGDRVR